MSYMLVVDRPVAGVVRVRLDRPARRNAIDGPLLERLETVLAAPDEPLVVLGSTDPRAFCAGGDLSLPPEQLAGISDRLFRLYADIVSSRAVVIAAVDGAVVGAGAQLLLCADVRIGGPSTRVSFAGAAAGLAIGTWGLPDVVGAGRAMELCLSGRTVGAEEASAIGLLDRVVDDADATAVDLAAALASAPGGVPARVKALVRDRTGDVAARIGRERAANAASTHAAAGSRRRDSAP